MSQVIFHIDLNSFFASAEVLLNPQLKGKPVAVGGSSSRGVISTASYEARKYGVTSAMPVHQALKLCPELIIIKGNHHYYEQLSKQFIQLVTRLSPIIEIASIDECYVDMSKHFKNIEKPLDIAVKLQQDIYNELGLQCSIGIAPNKFLAKMASEMKKPMGITVLRIQEVPTKLWPLPIQSMRGVGKKTSIALMERNIKTIEDLAKIDDYHQIIDIFGKNSMRMIRLANGYDDSEIIVDAVTKSLSQSTTLSSDTTNYEEIKITFQKLSKTLSNRLISEKLMGSVISITIKYNDFSQTNRSKKLGFSIYKSDDLMQYAMDLFDEYYIDEPIRLLGIGIGQLKDSNEFVQQLSLFESNNNTTIDLVSEINSKLEKSKVILASDLVKKGKRQ